MYSKILLPVDGSVLSHDSANAGLELARQLQASVVTAFIAPTYQYPVYSEFIPPVSQTDEEYQAAMTAMAETYFQPVKEAANSLGIIVQTETRFSDSTAKEIVHIAQRHGCDLIFMGSHGRSGLGNFLLGSVTTKVLSICQIPVLVHRIKHG
ncbi:universal stress protein [Undibacterium sp. Jales W-56]|uniref:universal stress protein n=1 Tax=Undibacterium sp. Jales W-56 TaxID=2897325 RepID=UPI0021D27B24|nr:universal stress protein [Undibacterium sp. Jales W-56]MCU6433780.1 universal stress protein [Undibacterium sp. Jales W-56]